MRAPKVRNVLSCIALSCYVGLEGPAKHRCQCDDQVDKTHIHCSVFRKTHHKSYAGIQELIGGLDSVSEETKGYMKCLHLSVNCAHSCLCSHTRNQYQQVDRLHAKKIASLDGHWKASTHHKPSWC